MTLCLLLPLTNTDRGYLRTKLWGEYSKWSQVKYQNELIRREASACLTLRMILLEWLKNTVTCAINTEVTGNEDAMHNLFRILVNAVINVHVSVQISGYARKILLKLQHGKINCTDILNMTININSLTFEELNQSKWRKKYTKGYRT
jgi:hypothetical protein